MENSMEILGTIFMALVGICLVGALFGVVLMALVPGVYNVPITATGNPIGSKIGEAEGHTWFFIFGDASGANSNAACKNGGITKISTVNYKFKNHMFIKQTYTCIVNGE